MKTTIFLLFSLFAIPISGQRGYCPCMERNKKNDGIDLAEVLYKITDQTVDLQTVAAGPSDIQSAMLVSYPAPPPPPAVEQAPIPQKQYVPEMQQQVLQQPVQAERKPEARVRAAKSKREAVRKKIKKRKRIKIRAKKRLKKYRGKCPKFNL